MVQMLNSPQDAAAWLRGRVRGAQPAAMPGTLVADSRRVRAGDGFVAWAGHAHDGRRFVPAALDAGAAACLVEGDGVNGFGFGGDERIGALAGLRAAAGVVADAFFEQPSARLDVIAVTGTNGKTSSAWWLAQALGALGRRCGVVGTLGVGEPGALTDTGLTTPEPVALQAAFRRFVDGGFAACAIEASSIGLAEHRLTGTRIAVAMFTNLTQDHLDYHGDMAAYWAAKRALFAWPGLRAAVLNIDDEHGAELAGELSGIDVWTTSLRGPARLQATNLRHATDGLTFEVNGVPVHSRVVGDFNAANLLGVIGALCAVGVPLADAVRAVRRLEPVPGRLQRVPGRDLEVLVDYAHTPDALQQALQTLRPLAQSRGGRLWCVFGCGGDRDATKRPLMGAIAAANAEHVVITSDNPRSEAPDLILAQILAGTTGISGHDEVDVIEDRRQAIRHAVRHAAAGDVVLVAGKGHEAWQETAGVRRPFSDVAEAQAALALRDGDAA